MKKLNILTLVLSMVLTSTLLFSQTPAKKVETVNAEKKEKSCCASEKTKKTEAKAVETKDQTIKTVKSDESNVKEEHKGCGTEKVSKENTKKECAKTCLSHAENEEKSESETEEAEVQKSTEE